MSKHYRPVKPWADYKVLPNRGLLVDIKIVESRLATRSVVATGTPSVP
jgi:hypothetical protein